jgi:hypothetical protein
MVSVTPAQMNAIMKCSPSLHPFLSTLLTSRTLKVDRLLISPVNRGQLLGGRWRSPSHWLHSTSQLAGAQLVTVTLSVGRMCLLLSIGSGAASLSLGVHAAPAVPTIGDQAAGVLVGRELVDCLNLPARAAWLLTEFPGAHLAVLAFDVGTIAASGHHRDDVEFTSRLSLVTSGTPLVRWLSCHR